jgi:hypothetical protein
MAYGDSVEDGRTLGRDRLNEVRAAVLFALGFPP